MPKKLPHILLSLLLMLSFAAAAATPALADGPAEEKKAARYEIHFMEDMIDHHHMAVMQAELCLDKAETPALLSMCENIIAAQNLEITTLQSWLLDWYAAEHDPAMNMNHLRPLNRLSGADFEIRFMQTMTRHHKAALRSAEKCLARAEHTALADTCRSIITSQTQEIQTMKTWLCDWYAICKKS